MQYKNYIENREQRTKDLEHINLLNYSFECLHEANRAFKKSIEVSQLRYDDFVRYLVDNQFILLDTVGTTRSSDTAFLLRDIKLDNKHLKHYFVHIVLNERNK